MRLTNGNLDAVIARLERAHSTHPEPDARRVLNDTRVRLMAAREREERARGRRDQVDPVARREARTYHRDAVENLATAFREAVDRLNAWSLGTTRSGALTD